MQIICLMGRTASGKSTAERILEQMGYKRCISYTTREPQFRNGKMEENGNEYMFVTKEKFWELVKEEYIIEYEEYKGNMYGASKPFGSTKFVTVMCIGGYRKLKELYGNQVLGVYLKIDEALARERSGKRDTNDKMLNNREKKDNELIKQMEEEADIIIDASQSENKVVADILKEVRRDK